MLITGTDLNTSKAAIEIARRYGFKCTVGLHPTSSKFGSPAVMKQLEALIVENRDVVVAVGECGLGPLLSQRDGRNTHLRIGPTDYDRLQRSPKATQLKWFPPQIALAQKHKLPLFLHCRSPESHVDFFRILREAGPIPEGGVVHSITCSAAEVQETFKLGFHVGVNGCSFKTDDNLKVMRTLPLDRLHLETDGPYCGVSFT